MLPAYAGTIKSFVRLRRIALYRGSAWRPCRISWTPSGAVNRNRRTCYPCWTPRLHIFPW